MVPSSDDRNPFNGQQGAPISDSASSPAISTNSQNSATENNGHQNISPDGAQPNPVAPEIAVIEKVRSAEEGKSRPPYNERDEKLTLLPSPQKRSLYTRVSKDGWLLELITLFLSIVLVIGIVILLRVYDGRQLPKWPYGLTLNTVVSILSNFASAALTGSVAAGISQLKWLWYADAKATGRRLGDLQLFDEASRGSLGYLKLLKRGWKSPLSILGIMITICSFAMGPMLQQTIAYPLKKIVSGTASVPRTQYYVNAAGNIINATDPSSEYGPDIGSNVTMAMQAAMLSGLSDLGTSYSDVSASCSTGNCTFSDYSTLGICASKANVTSFLTHSDGVWTLPNGHSLNYGASYWLNITTFIDNSTSLGYPEASNPLADIYLIYNPRKEILSNVAAFEIMLQICVQTLSTAVVSGKTVTNLTSTLNESSYSGTMLNFSSPDSGQDFFISDYARGPLQRALYSTFTGLEGYVDGQIIITSDVMQAMTDTGNSTDIQISGFYPPIHNTIISMTNNMRLEPGGANDAMELGTALEALGAAWSYDVFIEVSWAWLTLPFVLEVLALAFLLSVIQISSQKKIMAWKSSNLAVLRSLSAEMREALGGMRENSLMEREAETFDAALDLD